MIDRKLISFNDAFLRNDSMMVSREFVNILSRPELGRFVIG